MAVRRERPTWLVIAVTKADLFADDIDAAVHYYSPGSGSEFGDKLDELRALAKVLHDDDGAYFVIDLPG